MVQSRADPIRPSLDGARVIDRVLTAVVVVIADIHTAYAEAAANAIAISELSLASHRKMAGLRCSSKRKRG